MSESTITQRSEGRRSRAVGSAPQLFVALDCESPLRASSRHVLRDVDIVTMRRGKARGVERAKKGLDILLDDRQVSEVHARIRRLAGNRWLLEDAGSKNGVQVNGQRVRRALLLDGDVVEIGRTLLLYRESPAVGAGADVNADGLAPAAPELATFAAAAAEIFAAAARAAVTTVPITLLGETGVGKEVLARAIHSLSGRKGPFVAVNCGALPPNMVEATLFGHRRGAFSGAVDDNPGLIRSADGGTLLLDEIGDLPPAAQAAFLRVLQEQEVTPVGATRPVKVDLRVITATHRSLEGQVAAGTFRADLLARLGGVALRVPPLRERREDIGLLVGPLLRRVAGKRADKIAFTRAGARVLLRYDWPLNVRELEKALAAGAALAGDEAIDLAHLPAALRESAAAAAPRADADSPEDLRLRDELVALLIEHKGNAAGVARALGKGRMQVHRWLKRYGIDPEAYRR